MEKLREYLEGRSQASFAKSVDVSAPYISQILNGHRRPSFDVMERIEAATDGSVAVSDWRKGHDSPSVEKGAA